MRSYKSKTVPSIHLFPAISGGGEVEKEERGGEVNLQLFSKMERMRRETLEHTTQITV